MSEMDDMIKAMIPRVLSAEERVVFDAALRDSVQVVSEWQDISTAPRGKSIMLGKWCENQWFWIASGAIEADGMHWCDFNDASFQPYSHTDPTHWRNIDGHP